MFSAIVEEYVSAKSWDHLARVVRNSLKDSNLDEMVQLHFGAKPVERRSIFNVRRVVYNRLDDIPWLLKTDGSLSAPAGLRPEAPSFVPAGNPQHTTQPDEDEEAPLAEDAEDETAEHGDLEDVGEINSADYATAAPKAPTLQEITAHKTIVEVYRRYISLKRVNRNSSGEMRRRVFTSFSTEVVKMDWPHRYYRMLFLGPIPHLYIVVEGMKNHLHEARSFAKKRFNVVAHLELENMRSSLTQMNRSFKDAMELYNSLAPTSDLHKTRDLDKLKKCTLEAATLMRSLPAAKTIDWEADMKIALRGIVEVRKVPVRQPKPELNVEDLEDC